MTRDLCSALDTEAGARAKTEGIRFVALKSTDTDAANKQKARDAGFDPGHALWVLLRVERLTPATRGWRISLRTDAVALPQPADRGRQRRVVYVQSALLKADISRRDADKSGKTLIEGMFDYLRGSAK